MPWRCLILYNSGIQIYSNGKANFHPREVRSLRCQIKRSSIILKIMSFINLYLGLEANNCSYYGFNVPSWNTYHPVNCLCDIKSISNLTPVNHILIQSVWHYNRTIDTPLSPESSTKKILTGNKITRSQTSFECPGKVYISEFSQLTKVEGHLSKRRQGRLSLSYCTMYLQRARRILSIAYSLV